jgi:YD repeat-containing protein
VSDPANRLTSKAIPGGATLAYTYDPVGNLLTVGGDGRATPTTYQYDKLNLLEQMTESNGKIDVFGCNADHQRIDTWDAATYTDGGGVRYDGTGKVVAPNGFATHIHSTLDTANKLTGITTIRASSRRRCQPGVRPQLQLRRGLALALPRYGAGRHRPHPGAPVPSPTTCPAAR